MADVRRPLTWEDLGFARDQATGQWSEVAVRAAAGNPTWEDLGFLQDRSGRWIEAVRAGGHHFNPSQPRDPGGEDGGQWVSNPASAAAGAVSDPLKLAGKIDLAPDEKLIGSAKVSGFGGMVRLAAVDDSGRRRLRVGIGDATFGTRDDDAGPWRAGPDPAASINAERRRLRDEADALTVEAARLNPAVDAARIAAIEKRLDELDEIDTGEVAPGGFTADVAAADLGRFRIAVPEALDKAANSEFNTYWREHDRIERQRDKFLGLGRQWTAAEDARWDSLTAQLEALGPEPDIEYQVFTEGKIPGRWADIHYRVEVDDPSLGTRLLLAAVPHDDPELSDLADVLGAEQGAVLEGAEPKRLLRLLDKLAG